jgi:hypothetical protein
VLDTVETGTRLNGPSAYVWNALGCSKTDTRNSTFSSMQQAFLSRRSLANQVVKNILFTEIPGFKLGANSRLKRALAL